ncbi:Cytochrome P450 monooxygenase sdnE [Colletotrichum siamense]|uniref:Cytochrome P450 monooxygenase sdnE n=1 Tax=Colletotrichum siamense TaxID=690259 RepID=UPI0018721ADB|nr:Cytochrome P450 monooxygenase sdnE [Colletotrichum siamense]KAF5500515.1 Cytochrome P450 monooxygenase sdnE [Colletotrichum siamense]
MDWSVILLLFGAGPLLVFVISAIRRVFFSPLSKFPGPKFAALTLWNEFYWDVVKRGTFIWRIEDMHKKYGPIVRINPYELHIIDPEFYDELYSSNRKSDKYRWWTNLAGADGSSFSTVPHDLHRLRRGALNPFFSVRSVTQLEPLIRSKVEKLSARFGEIAQTGEVVRLDAAFMALTMDIICDYAFANDRKYLDEPDFKMIWKETIIGAFEGGAVGRQFPWMLPVMKRLPLSVVSAMNPSVGHLLRWQAGVKQQVEPILDGKDSQPGAASRTIFHMLRDSDLPPEEKTLQRLCDEAEILTGAGSETTAQTLTRILFYLKYVPDTLKRLREEIDAAMPRATEILCWADLQKLHYLNSVIREGLRLSYGVTTRLPRIAHHDIQYGEHVIPAGTPVSETPYFVLMHPTIFPEPQTFKPERWLEAEKRGKRLDKYLVSFGKGSRQCLGMNLAYAELYLATATVIRRFDWEMFETTLDDVVCKHDFFVAVGDLDTKGVRATLSHRQTHKEA